MYSLLLIGHVILVAMATTPETSTHDLQTHIHQSVVTMATTPETTHTKTHIHQSVVTMATTPETTHTKTHIHQSVDVMATTPKMSTHDLQTHIHQSVAVTAAALEKSTHDFQAHINQSDAVTNRPVDTSTNHIAAMTETGHVSKTFVDHSTLAHKTTVVKTLTHHVTSVHQSTEVKTQEVSHQDHVSPSEPAKVVTDHKVLEHHSTASESELPSPSRKPQVTSDSVSLPVLSIDIINNIHRITCIWRGGPQVIYYELIQGDRIVENITVHGKEAAVFKYNIPLERIELYCRAGTPSADMVISKPLRIMGDTTESKTQDKTTPDTEERDASPSFLISLNKILTSVTQPVQDLNIIIIGVCGPVILVLLLIIFLTHFFNLRGRKVGSTLLSPAV